MVSKDTFSLPATPLTTSKHGEVARCAMLQEGSTALSCKLNVQCCGVFVCTWNVGGEGDIGCTRLSSETVVGGGVTAPENYSAAAHEQHFGSCLGLVHLWTPTRTE